ncbi:MAG: cation:proton antiporter [Candidatus Thermoplasmatota archaeon]|jgi:Kef-type K+ transport system membrane component KefB|nr:cation:proton antiporter [Candidatus Thermoplasmatota archaeon]
MNLITAILAILFASTILGEITHRLGIERVVGNLISGIIIGPAVLNIIQVTNQVSAIEDISIFFIVLLIGIEVTTDLFAKNIRNAVLISIGTFLVPFLVLITSTVFVFHYPVITSVALSLSISVPSISIVSVLVMQNNLLSDQDGHLILLTTVLIDLFSFVFIASIGRSLALTLKVLFVIAAILAFIFILDKTLLHFKVSFESLIFRKVKRIDELSMTIIILFALVISSIFVSLNLSFILGAFFAGMLIREEFLGKDIYKNITSSMRILNNTFFIPIFFSIAGSIEAFPSRTGLIVVVVVVSIDVVVSLLLDIIIAKRIVKPDNILKTTGILGGRGAVGIVIATYSLSRGLINSSVYSIVILATIAISIASSSLVKMHLHKEKLGNEDVN